jgi:hypothetical protein
MCPFQCDVCHFRSIQGRSPSEDHHDKLFMLCIRRANLDALWSRESSTVRVNRGRFNKAMELSEMLVLEKPYAERGPFPEEDSFDMSVACMMLLRSLDRGLNANTIQYETMRGLRSHCSNFTHTVLGGAGCASIGEGSRGGMFFSKKLDEQLLVQAFYAGLSSQDGRRLDVGSIVNDR